MKTAPTVYTEDVIRRKKAYLRKYGRNPVLWIKDFLGVDLWSKQREVVESVFSHRRTCVPSCHGVGKTFVAACSVIAFMFLRYPSIIVTTAPTWTQVEKLLWAEINYLFKNGLVSQFCDAAPLQTQLRVNDKWYAIGISPKDQVNFQGFHQKNVLVVVDEAPGVRPDIIDGADSLMSAGRAHMLKIGNPIGKTDHFYKSATSDSWNTIPISAFDSPNFTGEQVPNIIRHSLINPEWVEEKKREWGEASPIYTAKVLGQFPDQSDRQIISYALCDASRQLGYRMLEDGSLPMGDRIMGVDVARFGSDLSCYARRQGNWLYAIDTDAKRDLMVVSGHAKDIAKREKVERIKVDAVGLGAGVVDRLREQQLNAVGVESAGKALDAQYTDVRTEMWFNIRNRLNDGLILLPMTDNRVNEQALDQLIADLTAPEYDYKSDGRYQMESKDQTKKRLGRSPDRGDATVLACYEPPMDKNRLLGIIAQGKSRGW